MHMKNNSWQPAVTAQCAEMMTVMNSSGTPTEATVFHMYCAVCEETATVLWRILRKHVKPSCSSIRKTQNKASRQTTAGALREQIG